MIELTPDGIFVSSKGLFCSGYLWKDIIEIILDINPITRKTEELIYLTDRKNNSYSIETRKVLKYLEENELEIIELIKDSTKNIQKEINSLFRVVVREQVLIAYKSPTVTTRREVIRVLEESTYKRLIEQHNVLLRGVSAASPLGKKILFELKANPDLYIDQRLVIGEAAYGYIVKPKYIPLKSFVLELREGTWYKDIRWDTLLNKSPSLDKEVLRWLSSDNNLSKCKMSCKNRSLISELIKDMNVRELQLKSN